MLNITPFALDRHSPHDTHMSQTIAGAEAMIRKTMRVGPSSRTSIKLEPEFWGYLKEIAEERNVRLTRLINEVADATPERTNLASTLRMFAPGHARARCRALRGELQQLSLACNTLDLIHLFHACPLPCLLLDSDRNIRQLNRAFCTWLNIDFRFTIGQRLESVMLVRGKNLNEMWTGLADGRIQRGKVSATYISPGKVRTAEAIVLALAGDGLTNRRSCVLMFTLAGRGPSDVP